MRVSDYIAARLAEHGIRHVFMITGGGAMHLNDALTRHASLTPVFCHHEQACAMAAESYTRLSGRMAALNVTTGPGAINSLNGVFGAYVDSIAMIVISGQVKQETMVKSTGLTLRQLGDQEADAVSMAAPVCKYAVLIERPEDIRYELEKALWIAEEGRPGPVWLDIPGNIQSAQIDPGTLEGFIPAAAHPHDLTPHIAQVLDKLRSAKRPAIIAGTGVRVAGAETQFLKLLDTLRIPAATVFNAQDLIATDHPCYGGRQGTIGDRAGNFTIQNADFVLIIGSRMAIRQVSYNWQSFARHAYKVMVDIDAAELAKPTVTLDLAIHADAKAFIETLQAALDEEGYQPIYNHLQYLKWCKERVARYSALLPEYRRKESPINPYVFSADLFQQLTSADIVVTGDGTAAVVPFQASAIKQGLRVYSNAGCASMGYDLPAAIGAYYAGKPERVICLAGDGSIMMNLQELQTIAGNKLPVKIFVLNNGGYHSILQTQTAYFSDNIKGCGPSSGVTFPDFVKVAEAFGIPSRRCDNVSTLDEAIAWAIDGEGPRLMEVMLDSTQPFAPKLSSRRLEDGTMVSAALEDMAPFLSREEFAENMLPVSDE
jgi:acetolactate synthase-1/2/3 large subunit